MMNFLRNDNMYLYLLIILLVVCCGGCGFINGIIDKICNCGLILPIVLLLALCGCQGEKQIGGGNFGCGCGK